MAPLGTLGQVYLVSTAVGSLFMCFSLFMGRIGHGHGHGHGGHGGHGGGHGIGHGGGHGAGHGAAIGGGHGIGHGGGGHSGHVGGGHGATPNVVAPGHHGGGLSGHANVGHGGHAGPGNGGLSMPSESAIAANQQFSTGQATALSHFHMPAQDEHSLGARIVELLNPMMIATFLTYFGLIGLICHFGLPFLSYFSLLPAVIAGYIATQLLLLLMNWMSARMEISSAAVSANFIGLPARVVLPIGEGRVGEVTYETGSKRYNSPARANDQKKQFERGDKVLIVALRDNIMYVEPWVDLLISEPIPPQV